MKPSSPDELVFWIKNQLKGREIVDIGEYISTLRELVELLRFEMPILKSNVSVFHNILGIELDPVLLHKIAQYAAAYLLINQLLFYQILSNSKPISIDENKIINPYELSRYFDKVLEEDYQAIYSVDVSRTLTVRSLYKVATTIRVLVRRYTGGQELRYA